MQQSFTSAIIPFAYLPSPAPCSACIQAHGQPKRMRGYHSADPDEPGEERKASAEKLVLDTLS